MSGGDWKEKAVATVVESHAQEAAAGGKSTGAEKALRKSQMIADMETVNAFLRTHLNRRTGQYDQEFTQDEWLAMPPEHQKKQLAVVESVLNTEALSRQARIADAQRPVRREPLTANPFATTKERT